MRALVDGVQSGGQQVAAVSPGYKPGSNVPDGSAEIGPALVFWSVGFFTVGCSSDFESGLYTAGEVKIRNSYVSIRS